METFNTNNLPDLSQAVVMETELDRNQAWLKQRQGKFTSSNVHKLMTYEDKLGELPKGAMTYIEEIVVEILTNGKGTDFFSNAEMERGNEKELEAVERFALETGLKCYATGENQEFIEMCSYFGGTPDGLIDEDALIEVKCPKSKTHLFNLRNIKDEYDLKKYYPNYYWQIQANLFASNRCVGFFISYDERFEDPKHQILIVNIPKDEDGIFKLKTRLEMAESYKRNLLKF